MFQAFRRKREVTERQPREATPSTQACDAAAPPPASANRLDAEMVSVIEADVLRAIGAVTDAIGAANGEVSATADDLAHIQGHMHELAHVGQDAASQSFALAASTEELAATSSEITRAISEASARIGDAVHRAREANHLISEFAESAREIAGIVDSIAAVARQTNLLALNATIEAARAGPAGRGFAVVASEVKSLSVETGGAANDIRARIARLQSSAALSLGAVESAMQVIDGLEPVFDRVRTSVDEQNASIGELAHWATQSSAYVAEVSERALKADAAARDASGRVEQVNISAATAHGLANGLAQRFVTVMRQNETGDRRRYDRFPTELRVRLGSGEQEVVSKTIDIGRGGLLIAPGRAPALSPGAAVKLDLERVGPVAARVVAVSPMGVHLSFDALEPATEAKVVQLLAEVEDDYRALIDVAQNGARQVEAAFEQAVAAGRVTREQLFDTNYRLIPGTDPQQYDTSYVPALEAVLSGILESLLGSDPRMAFCNAVDRNAYTPVHNRQYAQSPRPGDRAWNTAHCRNKRIFDDRAGISAARSTRPFLVQAYARDMGGTIVLVREVDAPIRYLGRHWGGFRTGYRL